MYKILFVLCLFASCSVAQTTTKNNDRNQSQIFIENQSAGEPGKCYTKMKHDGKLKWAEVICAKDITKRMIKEIQTNLLELNYTIDQEELKKVKIGPDTKNAINQFQQANNLAHGALDRATVYMIQNSQKK